MKELWPLEENKYKWVNIALKEGLGNEAMFQVS